LVSHRDSHTRRTLAGKNDGRVQVVNGLGCLLQISRFDMKALQLEKPQQFRLIELPEPVAPGPGEAPGVSSRSSRNPSCPAANPDRRLQAAVSPVQLSASFQHELRAAVVFINFSELSFGSKPMCTL
jgi:hypothetical protein